MPPDSPSIVAGLLAVNTGSSSVKLALYNNGAQLTELCRMVVEPIGDPGCRLRVTPGPVTGADLPIDAGDHRTALLRALDYAQSSLGFPVEAVGHRVVH